MNSQNQFDEQQSSFDSINKVPNPLNDILPAMDIVHKIYSLQPDMALGWKPNMRIVGPIPMNFDNPLIDNIIQQLTSFGKKYNERVVYLGLRPSSSYKMHQQIRHKYQFKYAHLYTSNYSHLAAFFRKFYSNFQSKRTRLFKGINPTINQQEQVLFQSNFEGGNLDAAIKVGPNEYDIFMRIDSNTRGHNQWFNFIVKNNKKKKIKVNICNFQKQKTLFHRGMKPYIRSKYLYETKKIGWVQGGINVKFQKKPLRYNIFSEDESRQQISFNCLQFEYNFQKDNDEVQFSYSPPYTYSQLLEYIKNLIINCRARAKQLEKLQYIKQGLLCESLSGLSIPILTITDFSIPDTKKKCILVSGRIHPGQSNSSFMMEGFIQYVCGSSKELQQLRQKVIIKIIPMINPDGVVMGNFRTSLCGNDLNRVFKKSLDMLFPQVKYLKELVLKLKSQFKNRLNLFLDFHGHSVKKNVFIYGPDYGIFQTNYYKTRMLPKIISNKTEMFRYYSCLFKISSFKRTTARAVILKTIPHCYTIQASNSCYYSSIEKKDLDFVPEKWIQMGIYIGQSLKQYINMLEAERLMQMEKRRKMKQHKELKKRRTKKYNDFIGINNQIDPYRMTKNQNLRLLTNNTNYKKPRFISVAQIQQSRNKHDEENQFLDVPQETRKLFEEIKKCQQKKGQIMETQGHQSDRFSEGGSDSEAHSQDLDDEAMNKLHNQIIVTLDEFKAKFQRKNYVQIKSRKIIIEKISKKKQKIKEKEPKQIQLIPCLRKRYFDTDKQALFKKTQNSLWPKLKDNLAAKISSLKFSQKMFTTHFANLPMSRMSKQLQN